MTDSTAVQRTSDSRRLDEADFSCNKVVGSMTHAELYALIEAVITVTGKDRYKRVIGRVHCDGVDINLAQAQAGLAWADPRYNKDLEIFIAVANAREQRIGLWVDPDPMPPWAWRRQK